MSALSGKGVVALRDVWHRLRPLMGGGVAPVVALTGVSVAAGLAEAGVLAVVAQIAAAMVLGESSLQSDLGPVSWDISIGAALLAAFGLAVVRLALSLCLAWLPARVSADVQAHLRRDLFDAYTEASWTAQSREREGYLQELMTNQITQATNAVLNVATVLSAGAIFLALTVSSFVISVPIALFVLLSAALVFVALRPLNRWGRDAARRLSEANVEHAADVSEWVRLGEESHVFGIGAASRDRVDTQIEASRNAYFHYQLTSRAGVASYQSAIVLLIVAGLAVLYAVDPDNLAALGAAVLILVRAGFYGQQVQGSYHSLLQMMPYLDRLEAAIADYRSSVEGTGDEPLPEIRSVALDRVGYAYRNGRPVLQSVELQVEAGQAVGVIGPSGAGKSTLVQLLLRLRTPSQGAYLVNGSDAARFVASDWHRRVSYVPQEPKVFQGSVADNIRFFRDLDDDAVERAARAAHIHDAIVAMPDGYSTVIGQRADAVSGGQRQRICLARALAGNPDLLVLDEPTSALDPASEAAVMASLAELRGKVTLVVVAHRPALLGICDHVVTLRDGEVIPLEVRDGDGTDTPGP